MEKFIVAINLEGADSIYWNIHDNFLHLQVNTVGLQKKQQFEMHCKRLGTRIYNSLH